MLAQGSYTMSQHKKITFAMLACHPLTMMHRKIICNFTWIYLGQHYIRKVLVQCWPRVHRYTFAGIPAFSNMSGGLFFNGVHYYQTILALFVQCWLRNSFTACRTTINRSRHWLEHLLLYLCIMYISDKHQLHPWKFCKIMLHLPLDGGKSKARN